MSCLVANAATKAKHSGLVPKRNAVGPGLFGLLLEKQEVTASQGGGGGGGGYSGI